MPVAASASATGVFQANACARIETADRGPEPCMPRADDRALSAALCGRLGRRGTAGDD
ncbi:hypothetical protein [Roseibium sp. MMSF_3412]|uniref:hypothetical protein n=1 Tax=Roseibium sp. MMSF_3412 TaxID=3046712 RepID=UPI00273DACC0|nr:hypothetical protein [Roseibium sp. MMSF_3412]